MPRASESDVIEPAGDVRVPQPAYEARANREALPLRHPRSPRTSEPNLVETARVATLPQLGYEAQANREASSFFDMPSVKPDKEYVDKSNTEVAWTPGYFGLIHFVPWEDFEMKVWSAGMKSLRDIPPSLSNSAKGVMEAARSQIVESNVEEARIARQAAELSSSETTSSEGEEESEDSSSLDDVSIEQQDYGTFTNCASVKPMMDSVILVVQSLLRASLSLDPEKRRYYVRCKNELEISTVKLTNSFGHNLRLSTPQIIKADVGVVLGVVKKDRKRKAPNSSVPSNATAKFNVGGVLPLCNFEMKGPTLDLTGMAAIAKVKHSSESTTTVEGQGSDGTEGNINNESREAPVYTAKEVAEAFNFLFSKSAFIDRKKTEGGPIRSSIHRISQVVTYAILSLGQCSFLYNLQSGIGFKVVGSANNKLTVAVTGVLLPNTSPNCGSAMYAIAKHCMDQYFADGTEKLSSKVRAVARKVSDKAFYRDCEPSDPSDSDYSPGEEATDDSKSLHSCDGDVNDENTARDELQTEAYSSTLLGLNFQYPRHRDMSVPQKASGRSGALNENLNSMQVSRTIDVAIKDMFENFEEVAGSGSSAVVMKSKFMKTQVAVKVPFDSSLSSKQAVVHEIETYLKLHRERCPLLGDVLPRLVVAWNTPKRCSVYQHMIFLVTEYVGRGLARNKKGQLCLGDNKSGFEVLSAQDEKQIRDSAVEGLEKMQKHGLLHCDVSLRNLRAERIVNQSTVTWRTWWVDLGRSTWSTSETGTILYDMDFGEAHLLFKS